MQTVGLVHLFLTILTCGVYLPVLVYKLTYPPYRCRYCGQEV